MQVVCPAEAIFRSYECILDGAFAENLPSYVLHKTMEKYIFGFWLSVCAVGCKQKTPLFTGSFLV